MNQPARWQKSYFAGRCARTPLPTGANRWFSPREAPAWERPLVSESSPICPTRWKWRRSFTTRPFRLLARPCERIAQALAAGRMVSIVYVYRDPVDSLVEGVLPRAQSMGRTVPLEVVLNTHIGSVQGILKIAEAYKNDPRLAIAIIDNRDGTGDATEADLGFVRENGPQVFARVFEGGAVVGLGGCL